MKSLNTYIQEKYLIDIDSEDDLEDPITCDLNEFCKWLKYKYDIDNKTIDEIESKLSKQISKENLSKYKLKNYQNCLKPNRNLVEPLIKTFKYVKNTDNWKIVSINGINLYYFSLRLSSGAKQSAIIITNNSKDIQYTFVI